MHGERVTQGNFYPDSFSMQDEIELPLLTPDHVCHPKPSSIHRFLLPPIAPEPKSTNIGGHTG